MNPTNNVNTAPVLIYILWFRPHKGAKWRKIARTATRAECVSMIKGSGEFFVAEVRDANLAGTLFDDAADTTSGQPGG